MVRTRFPGITPEAFVSDKDRLALQALQKVPLLPKIVQKFFELGIDRWMYVHNIGRSVRCGPKQFKTLHEILVESCDVLDMPVPELYVSSNPFPNAFAGGVERPYVVIRSSMIDALSDDEMFHLIGHELGHIKANHILYKSVAYYISILLEAIGRRTFGLGDAASIGLVMALSEWSRQAEISADRAGLLVAQELGLSVGANLALAAGPNRLSHEMSQEAFMEQCQAYQDTSPWDSLGKVIWFLLVNYQASHPMVVHRTQELQRWHASGAYAAILAGNYPKVGDSAA